MKNPTYFTANDIPLSLNNLVYDNKSTVTDIKDVVEEATTAEELMSGLNSLSLFEKFTIDRVTDTYARLKSRDAWGNTHYFKAEFDKRQSKGLDYYYDPMADNYCIPIEEMTDELMSETLALLKKSPWEDKPKTYLMFLYNDGEGDVWCITSWVE